MSSMTAIILHIFVAQVLAKDLAVKRSSDAEGSMDNFVDNLLDKLTDRANQMGLSNLDATTLGKTAPVVSRGATLPMNAIPRSPMQPSSVACTNLVSGIQDKMAAFGIPKSPMQNLALTAMASAREPRDVCAAAQVRKSFDALTKAEQSAVWGISEEIQVNAKEMAGVSAPLGFWDPLGLATFFKGQSILYFREAEIKHGRVCMLSFLGIVMGEKFHPFLGGDIDLPAAEVRSMFLETDFVNFWLAALTALGALEVTSVRTQYDVPFWEFNESPDAIDMGVRGFSTSLAKKNRLPGEFGFDPLNLKPTNPAALKEMQTKELNNGRLAMMAVAGILVQEIVTGQKTFN